MEADIRGKVPDERLRCKATLSTKSALAKAINYYVDHTHGQKGQAVLGHGLRPLVELRTQSWTFSVAQAMYAEIRAYI